MESVRGPELLLILHGPTPAAVRSREKDECEKRCIVD